MVIIHTEPGNDSECCLVDQVAQLAYNRKDHF